VSIQRHLTSARLSEAVVANGFIFLAGQVAEKTDGDAQAQTANVLAQIDKLLGDLGSDKSKLVDATIFLPNLDDFAGMNAAWEAWLPAGQAPTRATVQAILAKPEWKVEIKIIALA
jgi:enamine deaminase RidA (YjgF/YER057c/UK114 family)